MDVVLDEVGNNYGTNKMSFSLFLLDRSTVKVIFSFDNM